jgi:hypothetical protein
MPEPNPARAPAPSNPRSRPGPFRWAIAIVLLVLAAWAGWHTYRVFGQRSVVEHIDELGGMVTYDFEDTDPEYREAREKGAGLIASVLGNDYTHDIVEVNLRTTDGAISDEDLRKVSELSSVRKLSISNAAEVTDEGLAFLAGMPRLERLTLSKLPQVTDEGLSVLSRLPELRELQLASLPKITDEGFRHAAELANLQKVIINNCAINGSGWQYVQPKSLTWVEAISCQINDEALKHLADASQLEELSVSLNKIRGTGLAQLQNLGKLARLRLAENPLDPAEAVPHLTTLTSLEMLNLRGTPIDRKAGETLSQALPKCDITITGASYEPGEGEEEGKWVSDESSEN